MKKHFLRISVFEKTVLEGRTITFSVFTLKPEEPIPVEKGARLLCSVVQHGNHDANIWAACFAKARQRLESLGKDIPPELQKILATAPSPSA